MAGAKQSCVCICGSEVLCVFCRVKEEVFWRNYFYRVSLIKQSAQLTALAAQQQAAERREEEKNGAAPQTESIPGAVGASL